MTYKLIKVDQNEIRDFDRDSSVSIEDIGAGLGFILYSPKKGVGTAGHIWSPYSSDPESRMTFGGEIDTNLFDLEQVLTRHLVRPRIESVQDYMFYGFGGRFSTFLLDDSENPEPEFTLESFQKVYRKTEQEIKSLLEKWGLNNQAINLDFATCTREFEEDFRMIFHPWKNEFKVLLKSAENFPKWLTGGED
jgi:hypothetical protein